MHLFLCAIKVHLIANGGAIIKRSILNFLKRNLFLCFNKHIYIHQSISN